MPKPPSEWDEQHVLSLPLENDQLERKGTKLIDVSLDGVSEDKVRDELAKQLSAFANTGGGRIIYGLTDKGAVDLGGVSEVVKGRQPTKEWIEDLIPTLSEYEILGANVYKIPPTESHSQIESGKALYVVDVPDSDRAPHQSTRDRRYYVRIGSKSQPAPHKLVEDIRNRARHPDVHVATTVLQSIEIPRMSLPLVKGQMKLYVAMTLTNSGRVKANNACVFLEPMMQACAFSASQFDEHIASRSGPQGRDVFLEIRHPIYPRMSTPVRFFTHVSVELKGFTPDTSSTWFVTGLSPQLELEDVVINWTIYADSAPPRPGRISLGDLGVSRMAVRRLQEDAAWQEIRNHYYPD